MKFSLTFLKIRYLLLVVYKNVLTFKKCQNSFLYRFRRMDRLSHSVIVSEVGCPEYTLTVVSNTLTACPEWWPRLCWWLQKFHRKVGVAIIGRDYGVELVQYDLGIEGSSTSNPYVAPWCEFIINVCNRCSYLFKNDWIIKIAALIKYYIQTFNLVIMSKIILVLLHYPF